jgi:hypothetical protein
MASTYTTDLAIQLIATGENAGTWGPITNTNLTVVQQAIAGYQAISIAGGAQTTALVVTQNSLSTAKNAVIKLTGTITGNQIVTVPNGIQKTWIVSNGTVGAFTVNFKYASTGTGQTWSTTDKGIKILYADGTDIQVVDFSTLSGQIVAAQITNSNITQAKLASNSIGTAQLQTNAVTAVKITQSSITQAKLAANSVGSNQLIATAVTPASYTQISITVDADGRITAASSGAGGGAGMEIPTLFSSGPASGTYTANPSANRIGVYMYAGGSGGGGGGAYTTYGGSGSTGGYGFYNKPIVQPFSQPYAVGGGGNGGGVGPFNASPYNGRPGGSGGNTTIANVGTVNGATGGNGGVFGGSPGNTGSAGTQPASSLSGYPKNFLLGPYGPGLGNGGTGGNGGTICGCASYWGNGGNSGNGGLLVVFENIGK